MDENHSDGSVSTDMVRILLGGAPLARGELADILLLAGVDPTMLASSQQRIPIENLGVIWTELERAADDPNLGLHIGELRDGFPSGHVLFAALLNSPTVGQALERYCRFHDIMGDFVQPQLTVQASATALSLSPRPEVTLHRQHVEAIFSLAVSMLTHLAGEPCRPEVRFARPRPADIAEHLRIFGSAVRFEQPRDEVLFERSFLERPIAAADPELLEVLERYAERLLRRIRPEDTMTAKVAAQLSRMLCDGRPSLAAVAKLLAMSPRSLQGKLRAEGASYQAILDDVRKQLATAYLVDGQLSLAEIAFLLGYADQSAFNHAFRGWTGESPLRYRERQQRTT